MRLLYVHNDYYRTSGEEHAAEAIVELLREMGHEVSWYRRSSAEIDKMYLGNLRAALLSLYNPLASREIKKIIGKFQPELVQIQNLYPLISPRVLKTIKSIGLPVIMRCPNYRLFCPTGLFYDPSGNICEKCTGPGNELWCVRKNCMQSRGKSIGYALRNYVARKTDVYQKYVDVFIVQSEFQKRKFIDLGIAAYKISILPGIVPGKIPEEGNEKQYVTFVGRVSSEKGIDDFLEAAQNLPYLKFAIAGDVPDNYQNRGKYSNVEWLGFLKNDALNQLYHRSKMIVVPSKWYEGFPNVVTRAMAHSLPVITTNIGVFPEIVGSDCGLTYSPGKIGELVNCITTIDGKPDLAFQMGKAGQSKALNEYSKEAVYSRLMSIYNAALNRSDG